MLERHRDGTTANLRTLPLQSETSMKESCTVPATISSLATTLQPSRSPQSSRSGADRVQTLMERFKWRRALCRQNDRFPDDGKVALRNRLGSGFSCRENGRFPDV